MKWEYRFEIFEPSLLEEAETQFNSFGDEDWELVSVSPKMGKGDAWCLAILKRPKIDK